jgi:hypothetical protein
MVFGSVGIGRGVCVVLFGGTADVADAGEACCEAETGVSAGGVAVVSLIRVGPGVRHGAVPPGLHVCWALTQRLRAGLTNVAPPERGLREMTPIAPRYLDRARARLAAPGSRNIGETWGTHFQGFLINWVS